MNAPEPTPHRSEPFTPNAEGSALVALHDIQRTFTTDGGITVHALQGISLEIQEGEFVSIVGQSGSGKSTLMNILGCLDKPTSGEYFFAGRDIKSFDSDGLAWLRREAFGFVFQSYNLLNTCSAIENVEIPAIYAGKPQEERITRAMHLLESLGLGERMDHRPNQLSGGQQQRVSIARALMNGGKIILADEPTGALDSRSSEEVLTLLKELAAKGHTVIVITHDMDVAKHTDRVIEMRDGKIIRDSQHSEEPSLSTTAPAIKEHREATPSENAPLFLSAELKGSSISNMAEAMRMAFRSLKANVFRTILTLLGIVIGVSSVVAMLAIGEGAQRDVLQRISSMGTNMLTVHPSFSRGAGVRGGASTALSFEVVESIQQNVANIAGILPEIQGGATVRFGNQDYQTTVTATSANLPDTRSWPLAQGLFFTEQDSEEYTPVAVLGKTVYDSLFPNGSNPLGQYILISNIPFQIIGVMTSKGSSGFGGRDQDDVVFVPLKTGGLRLFGQTYVRSVTVAVEDTDKINETEQQLSAYLIDRIGSEDFRIFNSAELIETVSQSQQTFTILLGSVAAISLLVGGIGVMNIMLVSVTERTREIGIRMATGARQSNILHQFLAEAIAVSSVGGVLGVLLGIAIGKVIGMLGMQVYFSLSPMMLAFTCAVITGLIFGYAPARKAARLDPVVALAND
ncbi:Macrolide export ATP-binding/permease protein MacB [Thalassocella blandensis]|nr:Macrolide export ATP-binding/permease protein MacB [Thalassocella blandensis]